MAGLVGGVAESSVGSSSRMGVLEKVALLSFSLQLLLLSSAVVAGGLAGIGPAVLGVAESLTLRKKSISSLATIRYQGVQSD